MEKHIKIKIARIVASPASFISLTTLITELSKNEQFEVHLISDDGPYLQIAKDKFPNVKFHVVKIARHIDLKKDLSALFHMINLFWSEGFDIVHSHTPKAGLITALAGILSFRKKRIHTFTGQVWVDYVGFKRFLFKSIDKLICSINTFCYVDGHGQKKFLISNHIGSDASLKVVRKGSLSGLDTERFNPSRNILKGKEIRHFNFPNFDGQVILFLGRINQDKGIRELLESFNFLQAKYPLRLLMVGPREPMPQDLDDLFTTMCKDQSIVHIDFVTNVEDYYSAADIYCLPTYREGCPVTILEASAMEKPVVASRIYGVSDTVIEDETALLFEVKNTADLIFKLEKVITDKKLAKSLGENGRKFVVQNFKSEDLARELIENYLTQMS